MKTAEVLTDTGRVFLKAAESPEGPHALACELIGHGVAEVLGVPTPRFGLLQLESADQFKLPTGALVRPGPAFVSEAVDGTVWGGDGKRLKRHIGGGTLARLVVLDTLLRNRDRFPAQDEAGRRMPGYSTNRDNLLYAVVSARPRRYELLAIDFGHAIRQGGDIDKRLARIDNVRDPWIYGLFPEFVGVIEEKDIGPAVARLSRVTPARVAELVGRVPTEWGLDVTSGSAVGGFICQRAAWLEETLAHRLERRLSYPQDRLSFREESGDA